MKRLLLISLLWLVGCAGPRPQMVTVTLTPPPTLAHPHAWLTKEYPQTHSWSHKHRRLIDTSTDARKA
jgi:hypothetical protein